jgi:hypothetical protein
VETLVKFQQAIATVTVGLIGFAGVILSLSVNAWLDRRKRTEAIELERRNIRAALESELRIIKRSMTDALATLEKGEDDGSGAVLFPINPMSKCYETLPPKNWRSAKQNDSPGDGRVSNISGTEAKPDFGARRRSPR